MCFQKRLLYGHCNHSAPLGVVCRHHDGDYGKGKGGEACEGGARPRTHPLKTVRVERMCPACRAKKARADEKLATIAEKIRRLREELARRGFSGGHKGIGAATATTAPGTATGPGAGEGEAETGGTPGDSVMEGVDGDGASGRGPATRKGEDAGVASGIGGSASPLGPLAVGDGLVKRNDFFVGGVCLGSTSLTTISGKRLL